MFNFAPAMKKAFVKQTPEQENPDARQRILSKAEELFAENGFEGTSIRTIASEAGVNIAMISYYFSSKEKLLEGIIETKMKVNYDSIEELVLKDENHFDVLKRVIAVYVTKLFTNHLFHKMTSREMSFRKKSVLLEIMKPRIRRNREIILKLLKNGQRKGVFRKVDNELVICGIFGLISYVALNECMMNVMLNIPESESPYSEKTQKRVIDHLYSITESYLKF
jgi:AcrR family transcriptional regulator